MTKIRYDKGSVFLKDSYCFWYEAKYHLDKSEDIIVFPSFLK